MDDSTFDQQFLAEVDEERHRIRQLRRWERLGMLITAAIGLVLGLGGFAVMAAVVGRHGSAGLPVPLSGQYFVELYRLVAGRLSPNTALTAVLAGAGMCATINVALAVEHQTTDLRAQVAISAWRESLDRAARVIFVGVVGVGVAVWTNIGSGEAVGTAILTSLFAAVAAHLALSIRRQINSADQISGYARAIRRIAKLDAWHLELATRAVPQPLGVASMIGTYPKRRRVMWRRCLQGCGYRLMALAMISAAYFGILLVAITLTRLFKGTPLHLSWALAQGFMLQAVLGFVMGFVFMFGTVFRRWTPPGGDHFARHGRPYPRHHYRLDVEPRVVRVGYLVAVSAVVVAVWRAADVVWVVYVAGWLLPVPVTMWTALWASRKWPDAKWPRTATWPIWGLIELLSQEARIEARRDRDRFRHQNTTAA